MATDSIPWTKIKALSFDIYGTLLDWETGIAQSARATPLGPYLPTSHKQLMLDIETHDTTVQREHPTLPQTAIIAEGLRRYAADLGVVEKGHLTQEQVEQACADYAAQLPTYPPFADTVAAMQRLGKRYLLIPLSNVDNASLQQALQSSLKGVRFDAIYTAEDIGSYKPDPRNFAYLIEHVKRDFGVEAGEGELCHVAQSLFHDHKPAKEFGLPSVWVDRKGFMGGNAVGGREEFGYRVKVETLGELADLVDEAFEGV